MRRLVIFFLIIWTWSNTYCQENPAGSHLGDWMNLKHAWKAWWISDPSASGYDYGVFHFRKDIQLTAQPDHFIIHLSADNRYRLFVNGTPVCEGPAKGDFLHWQYESIDISKYLVKGQNTLAALVYNFGAYKSPSQFSRQTAFILQGDSEKEEMVNTDNSWKVFHNKAYFPLPVDGKRVHGFYVVGPCDSIVARDYPWNWEQPGFDDSKWIHPRNSVVDRGTGTGFMHGTERTLVKRQIPLMEEKELRFHQIVRSEPSSYLSSGFLNGNKPLVIEPNRHIKILIDNQTLNVGYPLMTFSGGKSARIKIEYGEALFDSLGIKGNRNDISGKVLSGAYDVILADGGSKREFRPLWLRTFRFVQIDIETKGEALTIEDFKFTSNQYPLEEKARVSFQPQVLPFDKIWETAWRTARLCANETYWDCPYYEQLQYIGDTRIQSLISLYVSGDDRLMRNALEQINNSIMGEGLTLGRVPSAVQAVIPPFSLIYIGMLHDYYLHKPDSAYLRPLMHNIMPILSWFGSHMQRNGLLGSMDWWQFTDWAQGFHNGIPEGSEQGNSSLLSLTYAIALKDAADLYSYFNRKEEGNLCIQKYQQIKEGVNALCFDAQKGIYADTPEKQVFSQHTNALAILGDIAEKKDQAMLMKHVLDDPSLIQCSMYYKFYLIRALAKSGMGNEYFDQLKIWATMVEQGLSTFPENEVKTNWESDTRSDCHAWSASVCYDYLSVICGITPAAPGFKSIRIAPNPGPLKHLEGKMPHPSGEVKMALDFNNGKVSGLVILPGEVNGEFLLGSHLIKLHQGQNIISLQYK